MRHITAPVLAISLLALLGVPKRAHAEPLTIELDPVWDTAVIVLGTGGAAVGHFAFRDSVSTVPVADRSGLAVWDAATLFPHDEQLSKASLACACLAMASPTAVALVADRGELLPAVLLCMEALSWTYAAKDLLKQAFPKLRPYAYGGMDLDSELLDEVDESFPSGHSALAFCAATMAATLCLELAPENPASPWLAAGGYCLALGTSVLRILSGDHFLSDVAAGAALGAGIGWLTAKAHLRPRQAFGEDTGAEKLAMGISPSGVLVKLSY